MGSGTRIPMRPVNFSGHRVQICPNIPDPVGEKKTDWRACQWLDVESRNPPEKITEKKKQNDSALFQGEIIERARSHTQNKHIYYTVKSSIKPLLMCNFSFFFGAASDQVQLLFECDLYSMFWVCKARKSRLTRIVMYNESETWLCECYKIVSKCKQTL